MAVIPVALAGRGYDVHVGRGLLERTGEVAGRLLRKARVPIVADRNAWERHGSRLESGLSTIGKTAAVYLVEPGESAKSWNSLAALTDWLLAQEVERGDQVVAFGGGVVGDLTGFAAAILKRGCGFIQLPTTLLAQVDSSVGGKTAINTAAGKNLVGAFHQPSLVLADLATLDTLPPRELRAGYAEVLKYGVLGNRGFFDWLGDNGSAFLSLEPAATEHAVGTSVTRMAQIVAEDERETTGRRALLNLGHTFGHALEAETGFSDKMLHGEAVALGMVLAAGYSARIGLISVADARQVVSATEQAGLPSALPPLGLNCDGAKLADHMRHDKKMDAGTLPFVLLRGIGDAFLAHDVDLSDIAAFLDQELRR
jgi:3-dehydroquinate synthase